MDLKGDLEDVNTTFPQTETLARFRYSSSIRYLRRCILVVTLTLNPEFSAMIADPMSDLTGGSQKASSDESNSKEVGDTMSMQTNMVRIDRIRTVMGITSGCVAGILGLTSLEGFGAYCNRRTFLVAEYTAVSNTVLLLPACFLTLHIFICLAIWAVKMKGNLALYTKQSWFSYLTTSVQPTALSFTLFWTLFYGLVYLY